MKLTLDQLKKIYYGAYSFNETESGYLESFHYTQKQMNYLEESAEFWCDRNKASNGKTLEFITSATQISFDYKITWIGSEDTIELSIDGLITKIVYIKDLLLEGNLSFDMPANEKKVIIYLSTDAIILIRSCEINAEYYSVEKNEKVLWMGDSITQGYGSFRAAHTYVNVANSQLNYDIINQGIGGFIYDRNILMDMSGYVPEKIIISLGSNQYQTGSMKDIEEYYERLYKIYHDIPVLCISPIWRGDSIERIHILEAFSLRLKDICAKYSNITYINGFKLVPHASEYFIDEVHPNALGMEIYGRNLVLEMKKVGF